MKYRIGIDVGGTNTDGAILDENLNVIGSTKVSTTSDVESGIHEVLKKIITEYNISVDDVEYAMLGTTHCTNAVVERKNLNKVAVLRIGKPATTMIPPFTDWPDDLRKEIELKSEIISGGYEFNGDLINNINKEEIIDFFKGIEDKVESVAISGVFSPVNKEQEIQVAKWVEEILGDIPISLSSEIGSIGLLERENASILNSALGQVGRKVSLGFKNALKELGIKCKIFFSQNDGTLMNLEYTMKYPIFTIGCGITNSIRGASFLSNIKDAIILDIGGTTTDVGILQNGFPRESAIPVRIGDVHTNFRMPDMGSIGLGGGTIISGNIDDFTVGPKSVGFRILEEALMFGGNTLTMSDVATKVGKAFPENIDKLSDLDINFCEKIYVDVKEKLENIIDQMKTDRNDVTVVLTGGGSLICPNELNGVSEIILPPHYKSANAVGASLGQISGEVDKVFSLDSISREECINICIDEAKSKAISAGAMENTIEVLTVEDIPLAYLNGNAIEIKVKVIGNLI